MQDGTLGRLEYRYSQRRREHASRLRYETEGVRADILSATYRYDH